MVDVWRNDKPFRKYYHHIKTSLSPTRYFLTHYRLLLTFLFYLKCHQHCWAQSAPTTIKYHFGWNIRPRGCNLTKLWTKRLTGGKSAPKLGNCLFYRSPPLRLSCFRGRSAELQAVLVVACIPSPTLTFLSSLRNDVSAKKYWDHFYFRYLIYFSQHKRLLLINNALGYH